MSNNVMFPEKERVGHLQAVPQVKLPDYLQRMQQEYFILNTNYKKLRPLIVEGVQPDSMSDMAWNLLNKQYEHMDSYRTVLLQRINLALAEI